MLLSDTLHLVGFNIFDRRRVEEERKLEKKSTGIFKPELKHAKSVYDKDENDLMSRSAINQKFNAKNSSATDTISKLHPSMKLPQAFSPFKTKEDQIN
jgi:hypothetical protein